MTIPIQAPPIQRSHRSFVAATGRVAAAGDCARNYWCCSQSDGSGATCLPCNGPGVCLVPQALFCAKNGMVPSSNCPN